MGISLFVTTNLSGVIKAYRKLNYEVYRTKNSPNLSDEHYIRNAFKRIVSYKKEINYIYRTRPSLPDGVRNNIALNFKFPSFKEARWYIVGFDDFVNITQPREFEMTAVIIRRGSGVTVMLGDKKAKWK